MPEEKLQLLLDIPETAGLFQFGAYAAALARAMAESQPHLTIGIFGEWGKGKTTLLNMLKTALERDYGQQLAVVLFDAWRYQREEHMLLPLLETIQQDLKGRAGPFKKLGEGLGRFAHAFAYGLKVTLPGGAAEWHVGKSLDKAEELEKARSTYFGWLSELRQLLHEFRGMGQARRVVILVDDLDRCPPPKVVEVLESVKVMLDVEGFVFVLALDRAVAERAVESHYGEKYGVKGSDYLKKLVQVEFTLPGLRAQDVEEYVGTLQARLGRAQGELSKALARVVPQVAGDNPREVKRFINSALISGEIASRAGVKAPPEAQVAFLALRHRWPGFVQQLAFNSDLLGSVKNYFEGEKDEPTKKVTAALLGEYPSLERFLGHEVGSAFLSLRTEQLQELVFYSVLTTEAPPAVRLWGWERVLEAVAARESLAQADLSGLYLSEANLAGAELRRANLNRADLTGSNLQGANLRGAKLVGANLRGATLNNADLTGANLRGTKLVKALLRTANLRGANLEGALLRSANLQGAKLNESTLWQAAFNGATLDDACLATLARTDWRQATWDEDVRKRLADMHRDEA